MADTAAKYTDEFRRETVDYITSTGRTLAEWARANDVVPFLQRHRQPPRQRRGRVFLCHTEERVVPPQALPDPRRRQACRHRVHRGRLQPQAAALHHWLPDTRKCHGIVLRAQEARIRAAFHGYLIPQASVSENLAQVN